MTCRSATRQLLTGFLVLGLVIAPIAQGADKKDKSARRMQQMMQKAQQEKAEMQAQFDQEKAALEDKIKKSEQDVGAVKGSLAAAGKKAKLLESQLESAHMEKAELDQKQQKTEALLTESNTALERLRADQAKLTQQFQEAQRNIKDGDAQRKELLANLSKKGQQVIACEEKNSRLYGFGLDLVKVYDKPESIRAEPFTQKKRVELENILQDYRDKLDDQRVSAVTK